MAFFLTNSFFSINGNWLIWCMILTMNCQYKFHSRKRNGLQIYGFRNNHTISRGKVRNNTNFCLKNSFHNSEETNFLSIECNSLVSIIPFEKHDTYISSECMALCVYVWYSSVIVPLWLLFRWIAFANISKLWCIRLFMGEISKSAVWPPWFRAFRAL